MVLSDEVRERARRVARELGPWTPEQRDRVTALFAADRARKDAECDEVAA